MAGVPSFDWISIQPNKAIQLRIFKQKARDLIDNSEKPMIICGGTGLYIKACLYDYQFSDESGAGIDVT